MDEQGFPHSSTGLIQFDPGVGTRHFDPWWALLLCDKSIIDYYAWLLLRQGIDLHTGSHWGPHICWVRGEEPADKKVWGLDPGPLTFHYSGVIRWDNGRHAWLDVWCPELTDLRRRLGLRTRDKTLYHLTLGRLVVPRENVKQEYDSEDELIL